MVNWANIEAGKVMDYECQIYLLIQILYFLFLILLQYIERKKSGRSFNSTISKIEKDTIVKLKAERRSSSS